MLTLVRQHSRVHPERNGQNRQMPRVSITPRRNIDAPLVDVDSARPWYVRVAQRLLGIYLWALIVYFVVGTLLMAVIVVVLLATRR